MGEHGSAFFIFLAALPGIFLMMMIATAKGQPQPPPKLSRRAHLLWAAAVSAGAILAGAAAFFVQRG